MLKHGFVQKMEDILDNETKITHEDLAKKVIIYNLDIIYINIINYYITSYISRLKKLF